MSSTTMTGGTVRRHRPRPQSTGALRLTRRGRLVVFLACLAAVCATLLLAAGAAIGSAAAGDPVPTRVVTVHPGDTLWGIASRAAPGEDPRGLIEQIRDLNAIGSSLQAGDKLDVPIMP